MEFDWNIFHKGRKMSRREEFSIFSSHYVRIMMELFKKYSGGDVLEIGSAPGWNLKYLQNHMKGNFYGVENNLKGYNFNKKLFKESNLNEKRIIFADVFSNSFQTKYKDKFDVIFSNGFIEHFENIDEVIQAHINLLKPEGIIFITIPNLKGFNYVLQNFFSKKILSGCNLNIMNKDFEKKFNPLKMKKLFFRYIGIFSFSLFRSDNNYKKYLLSFLKKIQICFNIIFNLVFRKPIRSHRLIAPLIIYVGIKTG